MKRLLTSCVAALGLLFFSGAANAEKTYINGIDPNYPPFAYMEKGQPKGFDVDSINWIAKKMGFKVVHQPMDWNGIIPALGAKKIDMICSGMSITDARKEKADFSHPYWTIKKVFVVKKGSELTPDKILKGTNIKLGAQAGTDEAELIRTEKNTKGYAYEVRMYDNSPLIVEDIQNGRIQAGIMDDLPANDMIARGKNVEVVGTYGEGVDFGVAMRKDDAELMKLVNAGYALLLQDPYWEELKNTYVRK